MTLKQIIEEEIKKLNKEFDYIRDFWNGKKGDPDGMTIESFLRSSLTHIAHKTLEAVESAKDDDIYSHKDLDARSYLLGCSDVRKQFQAKVGEFLKEGE